MSYLDHCQFSNKLVLASHLDFFFSISSATIKGAKQNKATNWEFNNKKATAERDKQRKQTNTTKTNKSESEKIKGRGCVKTQNKRLREEDA